MPGESVGTLKWMCVQVLEVAILQTLHSRSDTTNGFQPARLIDPVIPK